MNYREELVELPDGRTLEVATLGDPAGTTVLFHHGTPGSTRTLKSFAPLLDDGELLLVTTSRPGYGRSSRREGRASPRLSTTRARRSTHFGRAHYVALGWSGGGPHALACAALDAPRCLGAVVLAGVAPDGRRLRLDRGNGPQRTSRSSARKEGGPAYEALMAERRRAPLAAMTEDNICTTCSAVSLSDPDQEALATSKRAAASPSHRLRLRGGWRGFYDDDVAFMRSVGIRPHDDRTCRSTLFYGDDDLMVPADPRRVALEPRARRARRAPLPGRGPLLDLGRVTSTKSRRRSSAASSLSGFLGSVTWRASATSTAPTPRSSACPRADPDVVEQWSEAAAPSSSARPSTAGRRTGRAAASAPRPSARPTTCPTTGCAPASPWARSAGRAGRRRPRRRGDALGRHRAVAARCSKSA